MPEILKILGTVKRLEEKGGGSAQREGLAIRDQVHYVDHFGATIVKIGQPVQKILRNMQRDTISFKLLNTNIHDNAYEYS